MKFYFFPVAPNPTKVRLYLAEKKEAGCAIDLEPVVVNLREGEQKSEEHLRRDPLGRLPVLEPTKASSSTSHSRSSFFSKSFTQTRPSSAPHLSSEP